MVVSGDLPIAVAAGFEKERLDRWKPSSQIEKVPELATVHEEARTKKSYFERRKEALTWQKLQQEKEERAAAKAERRKERLDTKAKK